MELTRQRVRDVRFLLPDKCHLVMERVMFKQQFFLPTLSEEALNILLKIEGQRKVSLLLHPILEAYLTSEIHSMLKGIFGKSIRTKWEKKYGIEIAIESQLFS